MRGGSGELPHRMPTPSRRRPQDLLRRPSALADIASEQAGGGNNLSMVLTSVAYRLKVLSFVEERVLAREEAEEAAAAEVLPLGGLFFLPARR